MSDALRGPAGNVVGTGALLTALNRHAGLLCLLFINALLWASPIDWLYLFVPWLLVLAGVVVTSKPSRSQLALVLFSAPYVAAPIAMFGYGTWEYWNGTAEIQQGHPSGQVYLENYRTHMQRDRATRLPTRPVYARVQVLQFLPRQQAIRVNTSLFGYATNAWTGPMPEPAEVRDLVRDRGQIGPEGLEQLGLSEGLRASIIRDSDHCGTGSFRVVEVERDVLIVATAPCPREFRAFLVDIRGQRIIDGHRIDYGPVP